VTVAAERSPRESLAAWLLGGWAALASVGALWLHLAARDSEPVAQGSSPRAAEVELAEPVDRRGDPLNAQFGLLAHLAGRTPDVRPGVDTLEPDPKDSSTYRQFYRGVRVEGGEIRVQRDAAGEVSGVSGAYFAAIDIEAKPTLGESRALRIAAEHLKLQPADYHDAPPGELNVLAYPRYESRPLELYRLAWRFTLPGGRHPGEYAILVNAHDGKIITAMSSIRR
jgi:hypothetical protein